MRNVDKLRHEAIYALAGADYVRTKLLELLNTGPESLASSVYAVKCRVKDEDSLVRKVLHKRAEKPKKQYAPSNVTDIVGLRLLALNNERLPVIVEKFIDFIGFCQTQNVALFGGHAPGQAISEIKIYKSQNNPVVYDEIYSYLMARNLQDDRGRPEIELKPSTKNEPYSSVHFVCRANSYYSKVPKEIPVEIQIRTVFEDAWAEIDHPLRYKGQSYLTRKHSQKYLSLKNVADSFMGDLKIYVDHCLNLTDDIQNLYSQISRTFGRRAIASTVRYTPSGSRLDYSKAFFRITPASIKQYIAKADQTIQRIDNHLLDRKRYDQNVRALTNAITFLDKINEDYDKNYPAIHGRDRAFSYYYKMEKAFLLLWKNRVLNLKATDLLEIQKNNKTALELYLEMDRDPQYSRDAILKFRLATTLSIAGSEDLAQEKLRQAVAALKDDTQIPSKHLLRVTIPRQLSFSLWQRRQAIWQRGARTRDFKYKIPEQKHILMDCQRYIKAAIKQLKSVAETPGKELEQLRSWNNYVSYLWELRDIDGMQWKFDSDEESHVKKMFPQMDAKRQRYTRKLSGLDTALKAAALVADKARVRNYSRLVRAELKRQANSPSSEYSNEEIGYFQYCLHRISKINYPPSARR